MPKSQAKEWFFNKKKLFYSIQVKDRTLIESFNLFLITLKFQCDLMLTKYKIIACYIVVHVQMKPIAQ